MLTDDAIAGVREPQCGSGYRNRVVVFVNRSRSQLLSMPTAKERLRKPGAWPASRRKIGGLFGQAGP